jgi:hypothetical protein
VGCTIPPPANCAICSTQRVLSRRLYQARSGRRVEGGYETEKWVYDNADRHMIRQSRREGGQEGGLPIPTNKAFERSSVLQGRLPVALPPAMHSVPASPGARLSTGKEDGSSLHPAGGYCSARRVATDRAGERVVRGHCSVLARVGSETGDLCHVPKAVLESTC